MPIVTGVLNGGLASTDYVRFLPPTATSPTAAHIYQDQIDANCVYVISAGSGTYKVACKIWRNNTWEYHWCIPDTITVYGAPKSQSFNIGAKLDPAEDRPEPPAYPEQRPLRWVYLEEGAGAHDEVLKLLKQAPDHAKDKRYTLIVDTDWVDCCVVAYDHGPVPGGHGRPITDPKPIHEKTPH